MSKKQNEIGELEKQITNLEIFTWIVFIGLGILICLMLYWNTKYIDDKLKDLPHKVCENVTEQIEYRFNITELEQYMILGIFNSNCFDLDSIVLCDNAYDVNRYSVRTCVYPNDSYNWGANRQDFDDNGLFKYKCFIQQTKEVCKIE